MNQFSLSRRSALGGAGFLAALATCTMGGIAVGAGNDRPTLPAISLHANLPEDFDRAAYDKLSEAEQQARYQADVERMLDETVFPVLRRHGMEVGRNRSLATRVHVTGARWYAPLT